MSTGFTPGASIRDKRDGKDIRVSQDTSENPRPGPGLKIRKSGIRDEHSKF